MGEPAVRVGVIYDFASTLCFVADRVMHRVLPRLEAIGVELAWQPIDLCRLTGWQRGRPLRSQARNKVEVVSAELGVEVPHIPRTWMDSRPAAELALALGENALGDSFRTRVFERVYSGGSSLDEPGFLESVTDELGLSQMRSPPSSFEGVDLATREAQALGVAGVPSFVLGQYPVGGIQDGDTMLHFLGRYAARFRNSLERKGVN